MVNNGVENGSGGAAHSRHSPGKPKRFSDLSLKEREQGFSLCAKVASPNPSQPAYESHSDQLKRWQQSLGNSAEELLIKSE